MRGWLTIGGHHGNIFRCVIYFSTSTYICSCNLSIASRGKQSFRFLSCYHGNKGLKNQVFKKYLVFSLTS